MQKYEVIVILISEEKAESIAKIVEEWTKVLEFQAVGLKKLAYKIEKSANGFYLRWLVETENEKILKLQKELKKNADVLRYLVVKTKKDKLKAEAIKPYIKPEVVETKTIEEPKIEEKPIVKKKEVKKKAEKIEKVSLEELDKKLEELLKE